MLQNRTVVLYFGDNDPIGNSSQNWGKIKNHYIWGDCTWIRAQQRSANNNMIDPPDLAQSMRSILITEKRFVSQRRGDKEEVISNWELGTT